MGNGGHAHADLGSIDLTLRGRPVIVDPGTWSYLMGEGARDSFRGAAAHAAACVDGEGSAQPGGAFSWTRVPQVLDRSTHLSPECDIVAFSHDGFLHLENPVSHRRVLLRIRHDYWLVIDHFRSDGPHEVTLVFPLAAGLRATIEGPRAAIGDVDGSVAAFISADPGQSWLAEDGWTSNAYGRRVPAKRLVQRRAFDRECVIGTLVQSAGDAPVTSFKVTNDGSSAQFTVERDSGQPDRFRIGPASGAFHGAEGEHAEMAWSAPWPGTAKKESS